MLWNRLLVAFLLSTLPLIACSNAPSTLSQDRHGLKVLEHATSDDSTPTAAVGVLDSLYDIERYSPYKREIYIELLDYYIGSAAGAVLNELITTEGKVMLPHLQRKLHTSIDCDKKFNIICITDIERRNKRIRMLSDAITEGIILKVIQER